MRRGRSSGRRRGPPARRRRAATATGDDPFRARGRGRPWRPFPRGHGDANRRARPRGAGFPIAYVQREAPVSRSRPRSVPPASPTTTSEPATAGDAVTRSFSAVAHSSLPVAGVQGHDAVARDEDGASLDHGREGRPHGSRHPPADIPGLGVETEHVVRGRRRHEDARRGGHPAGIAIRPPANGAGLQAERDDDARTSRDEQTCSVGRRRFVDAVFDRDLPDGRHREDGRRRDQAMSACGGERDDQRADENPCLQPRGTIPSHRGGIIRVPRREPFVLGPRHDRHPRLRLTVHPAHRQAASGAPGLLRDPSARNEAPSTSRSRRRRESCSRGGPTASSTRGRPAATAGSSTSACPLLGICYGMQLMSHLLQGQVKRSGRREYGQAEFQPQGGRLLGGLGKAARVWMSHGDDIQRAPAGFAVVGRTGTNSIAAIENLERRQFGILFHPEVVHTEHGIDVLTRFLDVCGCRRDWNAASFVESSVQAHPGDRSASVAGSSAPSREESIRPSRHSSSIGRSGTGSRACSWTTVCSARTRPPRSAAASPSASVSRSSSWTPGSASWGSSRVCGIPSASARSSAGSSSRSSREPRGRRGGRSSSPRGPCTPTSSSPPR